MHLRVLGTAAGGGYPQWNCACRLCQRVRQGEPGVRAQWHASLAVSATGNNWYLVNATPDVRFQIESHPALHPGPGLRQTPIRGVLLTDAELDHTIGLLILREGLSLDVYASDAVLAALQEAFPIRRMLQSYAPLRWLEIRAHESFRLDEDRLQVSGFRLGVKRPRYTTDFKIAGDWVLGYRFEDLKTGGVAVYAPGIEQWSAELIAALDGADCAFVDGTFWTEDEMIQVQAGTLRARDMGHIPIRGAGGSAEHLAALAVERKIYVHINNTNPVLDERSPEHRYLSEKNITVGRDGMDLEV